MANGSDVTIKAPAEELGYWADILGNAKPEDYASAVGGATPAPAPAPQRQPATLPQLGPKLWQSTPALAASPTGPGLARPMLGRIPTGDTEPQPRTRMGEVKHILGTVGQIAGSALIPGVMPWIPGTTERKILEQRLGEEKTREETEAELRRAEAAKDLQTEAPETAETRASLAKQYGLTPDMPDYRQFVLTGKMPTERPEGLSGVEADVFHHLVSSGMPEADALAKVKGTGAAAKQPKINYDNGIPVSVTTPDGEFDVHDPNLPPTLKPLVDSALSAHQQAVTEKDTAEAQREAASERRQARSFAEMEKLNAMRAQQAEGKQDKAFREKVLTYYTPAQDADVRLNLMNQSMQSALKGDQQAMVNLLSNHVAMVMGMPRGKVPRISHEMFAEAQQSAPFLQRVTAHWDKDGYLTGVVLTPEQMRSMVKLGEQTAQQEWSAANSKADYIGVSPDDRPKRIAGGGGAAEGGTSVSYGGKTYNFPDEKAAASFRKELGIK